MKVAVMGAGAVGCWFGGLLAEAGHDVTLIGRPALVDAVRAGGLRLQSAAADRTVALRAEADPAAVAGADLVWCCVKSIDTETAGAQMAPHLTPGAQVWSLQNGVDNAPRLAAVIGRPVSPAVVYVATEMAGPAHVRHHGRGELVVSPADAPPERVAAFAQAGIALQASDNVVGALWAKLLVNCAYNALCAISGQPYGPLSKGAQVPQVMREVLAECQAVAAASGVTIPGDPHEAVRRIAESMPAQMSSTAQDLARGRRTEIDHLNGHIVALGDRLGIAVPANRVLTALVKLREAQPAS
jgi:2-dehydropantoate 2-reductase